MVDFRLSHYSAAWKQEFDQAKSMLLWATEGWITEVCHIGSTSVEGSIAAPTIDIVAGISSLSALNEAAQLIEGLHYRRLPAPVWTDHELVAWLVRYKDDFPSHTVLLAKSGGNLFRQCLAIQHRIAADYLVREELGNLKKEHFNASSSLPQYQDAKSVFFQRLLNRDELASD